MSDNANIQQRVTLVCGEPVTVYSFDSWRWFSKPRDAELARKRAEKVRAELSKSLKRYAAFKHATRRIARD